MIQPGKNFFTIDRKVPFVSKPLSKVKEFVGQQVKMFILDDTKEVVLSNVSEWIKIASWNGESTDKELDRVAREMIPFLFAK